MTFKVADNVLLGVFSSIVDNVSLSLAEIERVIYSIFDPNYAQKLYNLVLSSGKNVIKKMEESITDEVAYYIGRVVGDAALTAVGIYGTIDGLIKIGSGVAQIGTGIAGTPETLGSSLVLVASGAATTAIATAEIGVSVALAVNAGKNAGNDAKKLKKAIKESKKSTGNDNDIETGIEFDGEVTPDYIKDNRVPLDKETILSGKEYQKTKTKVKGAQVYKYGENYYYRDTFHTGEASHLEVFDKWGNHLGEANPLTGDLIPRTADPTKKLNVK